jgi:hypothetical protein
MIMIATCRADGRRGDVDVFDEQLSRMMLKLQYCRVQGEENRIFREALERRDEEHRQAWLEEEAKRQVRVHPSPTQTGRGSLAWSKWEGSVNR